MKKILILGGSGYIGQFFNFLFKTKYNITNIDTNWFSKTNNKSVDFNTLTKSFLEDFETIILLAGHSSVKMCDKDLSSSFNNNVSNFISLIEKLNPNQKFIYASSSSVYGNTNNNIVSENYNTFVPNNNYDVSKQIIDMYASISNLNYYGLRFGTVNGWSPNLRTDVMINAMVNSALTTGEIKLYTKDIMRPILGIKDLCNALCKIIEEKNSTKGIYNLASFNSTSGEIAYEVSRIINCPVTEYEIKQLENVSDLNIQKNVYNFAINSLKFEKEFNFVFEESVETITKSLIDNFDNCQKSTRNNPIPY